MPKYLVSYCVHWKSRLTTRYVQIVCNLTYLRNISVLD